MATRSVRTHNRRSTYRTIKTKSNGTRHVYVKSSSVKSHRRKSK